MPFDFEYFREKRDSAPVWCDPRDGVWNVYRYADVVAILGDWATFSSDFSTVLENDEQKELTEGNILTSDPPRHQ